MSKEIILKEIDFKSVGAPTRSVIGKDSNNHLYIIKNIKSRIIMKDGRKIVETVKQIKDKTNSSVSLATTAPVCSKTKRFLNENDIRIIYDYIIKWTKLRYLHFSKKYFCALRLLINLFLNYPLRSLYHVFNTGFKRVLHEYKMNN